MHEVGKAAIAALVMLAGSPATAQEVAAAPPPASLEPAADAPPVAPAGAVASLVLPAREEDGAGATPNRHLTPAETGWHLRTALNVAALGCRGPAEAETVAGYNAFLAGERAALTTASDGVAAAYRTRYGAAWQARYDDHMTRLYNFWAQPAAHDGFCQAADAVLRDAATLAPTQVEAFAGTALPRLEQPFVQFFAAVETYRTALAQWQGRHAPALPSSMPVTVVASLSPTGTGPALR